MTSGQYLDQYVKTLDHVYLKTLIEECHEGARTATSTLILGWDNVGSGQTLTNAERLTEKLFAIVSTACICGSEGFLGHPFSDSGVIEKLTSENWEKRKDIDGENTDGNPAQIGVKEERSSAMNLDQYYLTCLIEECAEVVQRATKALRFGLNEIEPGQPLTNAERLNAELRDVVAVATICGDRKILDYPFLDRGVVEEKHKKIMKFMKISLEQGTLDEDPE